MSKIKAFVTALILTTSSAAMADATFSASASARVSFGTPASQPVVRDHRTAPAPVVAYRPRVPAQQSASWQTLATNVKTDNNGVVIFPTGHQSFSTIRLQQSIGTARVDGLKVSYKDGGSETINLSEQWLDVHNPPIDVAIKSSRAVEKITILTWTARSAAQFKVLAFGGPIAAEPAPYPVPSYEQPLAQNLSFSRTGRIAFTVESHPRSLKSLRLQAVSGTLYLNTVTVRYTDGTTQTFDNIKRMRIGETVELKTGRNKQIARVVVNADASRSPGKLSVFAL